MKKSMQNVTISMEKNNTFDFEDLQKKIQESFLLSSKILSLNMKMICIYRK